MSRTLAMLAVILTMGTAASLASAHHSHTIFYDLCKRMTIEGRIEKVDFKDPHTSIHLTLDDGAARAFPSVPWPRYVRTFRTSLARG